MSNSHLRNDLSDLCLLSEFAGQDLLALLDLELWGSGSKFEGLWSMASGLGSREKGLGPSMV